MEYDTTIGVDVSDRTSKICVMRKLPGGERGIVVETTCATTKEGFSEAFAKFERTWPVAFETGTHCRWMKAHIESLGFKVIVANPAEVKLITDSNAKSDRSDARTDANGKRTVKSLCDWPLTNVPIGGAGVPISSEAKPSLRSKSIEVCRQQSTYNENALAGDCGAPPTVITPSRAGGPSRQVDIERPRPRADRKGAAVGRGRDGSPIMRAKVRPIRYFSPTGEGMPNGCYIQRGGFLVECSKNARSFVTAGIADKHERSACSCGGILIFPDSWKGDVVAVQNFVENPGIVHAVGHAFWGRYGDPETGEGFGSGSMTIEVGRLSSCELRQLAVRMAKSFALRHVLVKDLNDDRFYLVGD